MCGSVRCFELRALASKQAGRKEREKRRLGEGPTDAIYYIAYLYTQRACASDENSRDEKLGSRPQSSQKFTCIYKHTMYVCIYPRARRRR